MIWWVQGFVTAALLFPGGLQASQGNVLDRSPQEWTKAVDDHWKGWDADTVPPVELQPFLVRAVQAYSQGHMPLALDALYDLLEAAPDYPSALHQSGVIYFRLRRYGDAIVALERYLTVAPQRLGDTRVLAHCYYTLGRYEQAKEHYEKVLKLNPDSVEARRGYGLCFMRLGFAEEALVQLKRVLELDTGHSNAATWIAQVLFDMDQVEEALEAAQSARDLDPYEPRPWFLLSQIFYILEREEDGDAAKMRFDELNRIAQELRAAEARLLYDPRQEQVHRRLIMLHRQAGNLRGVGQVLNRWLKVEPWRIELRVVLLDLAQEMNDGASAARLADNLRQLAKDDLSAWQALARYYAVNRDRVRQVEAEGELARLRAANSEPK
jgi:predicted Zn-dependent protease